MSLTTLDLFAGAGGLSLGMEMAGFEVAAALEVDKWAADTFRANFPRANVIGANVADFTDEEIAHIGAFKPAAIVGGPPCQGFSHSNVTNRDPRDPRNTLFRDYLRWVAILRPPFFLIENVAGILAAKTADGTPVMDAIEQSVRTIGYVCRWKLLQAADFGVPQNRERLFIVGAISVDHMGRFAWPAPSAATPVTLWQAISDLPEEEGGYASPPTGPYQEAMRLDVAEAKPTFHEPMRHTRRIIERFQQIGYGQSEASVGENLKPLGRRGREGVAYCQNSRRQHPDKACSTVVASSHTNFIHPYFHRNFTVRELMRIQSFPDKFQMKGKRAVLSRSLCLRKGLIEDIYLDQRMQVGNAVPPLLARAVAERLLMACSEPELLNAA